MKNPFIQDYSPDQEFEPALPISDSDRWAFLDSMAAVEPVTPSTQTNLNQNDNTEPLNSPPRTDNSLTSNYSSPMPRNFNEPQSVENTTPKISPTPNQPASIPYTTAAPTNNVNTNSTPTPSSVPLNPPNSPKATRAADSGTMSGPTSRPVEPLPAFRGREASSSEQGTPGSSSTNATQKPTRMTIDGKLVIVGNTATIQGIGSVPEV